MNYYIKPTNRSVGLLRDEHITYFTLQVDKIRKMDKIQLAQDKEQSVAEVAELADALRSGRSDRTVMRVQIPPSAQKDLASVRGLYF